MTIWSIEPRDPLIVRDGRPFGPDPGARAVTLPFPFPSTIAGGLRSLAGRGETQSFNTALKDDVLKRVKLRGPLLVEIDEQQKAKWFAPVPADASIHQTQPYDEQAGTLVRFIPATLPAGAIVDRNDSLLTQDGTDDKNKAHPLTPQFWMWDDFERWLVGAKPDVSILMNNGIRSLETNTRMHVKIKSTTQTAEEGFLFQTRGLEFTTRNRKRLMLAGDVEVANGDGKEPLFAHFSHGLAPLGGERRLMHWIEQESWQLPEAPGTLFEQIGKDRGCRIILLTPAFFTEGYRPSLLPSNASLHPKLVASAVSRAQVASGWDMLCTNENGTIGAPKPTRRLAPAGSVYFVKFDDADDAQEIQQWAHDLWMTCISEDEQSQRDGFGLIVFGVWNQAMTPIGV